MHTESTKSASVPADDASEARDQHIAKALGQHGFRVSHVLGRGGFGVVFAAQRASDEQTVAIKVSFEKSGALPLGLFHEADALEQVGPPHVPAVFGRGEVLGHPFLALERIAAPTLADQLVAAGGPLPLARVKHITDAILVALETIHAHGLVHRDLKPENIFLVSDREARIIDFGQARAQKEAPAMVDVTLAGDDIGTAEYMAPEQCDGLLDADVRSDIYACGILLYEMITGAPPFWGAAADVREAQRSRRPARLTSVGCPFDLDEIVRRCLAKERSRRFADAASLRAAIKGFFSSGQVDESQASSSTIAPLMAAAPARPAAGTREQQTMALLFFESNSEVGEVRRLLSASGGEVVQTNGVQYVATFGHDIGDNPVRLAVGAAQRFVMGRLSNKLVVDLAQVTVQVRPDGSRRATSVLFGKKERFPAANEPDGVLITDKAFEVLSDLNVTKIAGSARMHVTPVSNATEATKIGVQLESTVGRDELLRALLKSAQRTFTQARGTLVTLVGEPGYGKTHIAHVVAQRIEPLMGKGEVIRLTAQENMLGAVSQLVPTLLRRLITLPATTPADDGRALLTEALGEAAGEQAWVAAALALGFVAADHPEVRKLAAAPGALRLATARATGEALRQRARVAPLAVVLDDAHLADEAMLDALEYATMNETGARLWLCVLARPSLLSARATWGQRAVHGERFTVEPLIMVHAMELARRLLLPAEYVPVPALQRLAERTQGIPQLLYELVRGLKRDGLVRRSERGAGYVLASDELDKLPDLPIVQWNARREIEALPAQLAGHARLAAALSVHFTPEELDGLITTLEREGPLEDMQLDAHVGVQRLIDAGMLVRHRDGRIDFRHALLRDTIYQLTAEAQRKKLHRAAFELYQTPILQDDQRLPRLALHASRCGEAQVAAGTYLLLAERALNRHAYQDAENAFGGALAQLNDSDARYGQAARGRGWMRFRLARLDEALADLRRAHALAERDGALDVDLLLDEATVLDWLRDFATATELVQRAEQLSGELSPLTHAKLLMGIARSHHRKGEAEQSVRLHLQAAQEAEALGDVGYETRVGALGLAAYDCANLGLVDDAQRHFDAAIQAAEARSDLQHVGGIYLNRCGLWLARHDVPRALEDMARAQQVGREIGVALLEYCAVGNIGEVSYMVEQLDEAERAAVAGTALAIKMQGEEGRERNARALLSARIALYRGDEERAAQYAAQIRERIRSAEQKGNTESALVATDEALLRVVELCVSHADEEAWRAFEAFAATLSQPPTEEVECIELRALSAHRHGAIDQSKALLTRALALCDEKPNVLRARVARRYDELFGAVVL